jgi:hypothetical protein
MGLHDDLRYWNPPLGPSALEIGGSIADVRYMLAFGQVLDSDLELDMFEWTPSILITGWFYSGRPSKLTLNVDITV